MTYTRHIPLEAVLNLRDLGGYPTPSGETAWGRAFRAGNLHPLTEAEIEKLEGFGIGRVIDLRYDHEIENEPNPFATRNGPVEHINVSLFPALDPSTPKFATSDNPLLTLYMEAVDTVPERFVEVMQLIAETDAGVLFHCTAGKDRTGLIAMMLLDIAGASREAIIADYALTAEYLTPMVDATRAAVEAEGGDFAQYAPYLESKPETMSAFLDYFLETHGGARAYLSQHGLGEEAIDRLAARFVPNAAIEGAA